MNTLVTFAVVAGALPLLGGCLYLAILAIAARRIPAPAAGKLTRFTIVVPAHNEEALISRTVTSLLNLDYPRDRFNVLVVADNCEDATASRAQSSGATAIERTDTLQRGKGFALSFGFAHVLHEGWANAVVVVDADTVVSPNLLGAFGARLEGGSESAQAEYAVRNTGETWRTRLMALAFTLHHTLRSLGRERLGLSCGLRGNGMAFSTSLLRRISHQSTALAEDVEHGIILGLAGVRVAYVHEASVFGEMPTSEEASRTQRQRWEGGRRVLQRQWLRPLLRASVRKGWRIPLDLALDLAVPPLVTLTALVGLGFLLALGLCSVAQLPWPALIPWALSVGLLLLYTARGCALSPAGWRVTRDLLWVPAYALWKISVRLRAPRTTAWIRTARPDGLDEHAAAPVEK